MRLDSSLRAGEGGIRSDSVSQDWGIGFPLADKIHQSAGFRKEKV